ncbi:MAG: response regulator [Oscillospiraceae bacterium]|nr:response regulator [Oscillospiraceae bacterium]
MELGAMIKKYRLAKNVTQEEMACALFVTPQAVSRWENGLSLPDIAMIPRLVKYLGVSADVLLGCNETECKAPAEANNGDMLCQDQINCIFGACEEKRKCADTKTVLVVDDASFLRSMLCDILGRSNYRVLSAADGRECLDLLEREKADVCTLDIGMPGMNGLEVLAEIKRKYPGIKVIMLSAQSTKENVMEALRLGAEHFIAKPFKPDTLLKLLDRPEC